MSRADEMFINLGFKRIRAFWYIKNYAHFNEDQTSQITVRFSTKKRICECYGGRITDKTIVEIQPELIMAISERMKELGWIPETDQVSQIKESIVTIQKFKNQLQEIKKSLDDEIKAIKEKEAK